MADGRDPNPNPLDVERRGTSRRMSWLPGLGQKRSAPPDSANGEGRPGLLSRNRLAVVAAGMLTHAAKAGEGVACTIIRVDAAEPSNCTDGLGVADKGIQAVADALRTVFRRSDSLARWGQNSFVVLALGPGPDSDDVERRMAQRLTRSKRENSSEPGLDICAGRVVHMPWQDEDLDHIVERAAEEMSRRRHLRRAREHDIEEQ